MLIYGKNSVREALNSGATFEKVFIQDDLRGEENQKIIEQIKNCNAPYTFLTKKALDKKAAFEKHQGFVAEVSQYEYSTVDDILNCAKEKGEQVFIVLLDGIEDPHNLGSIIRSCECAGVQGVIMEKRKCCEVNATVMKVSAGALNYVKVAKVTNLVQTIEELKRRGIWIYSVELGGQNIYDANLKGDIGIVIGSEGFGTRRLVKEKSDEVLTLPMRGKVNSLNASNACAIALFEALRQRL
ncbi:MAG: 23S rRNA (guanosine(2251)-2'-O)-methyltransferase RlmB [Christensenellales bacterium]